MKKILLFLMVATLLLASAVISSAKSDAKIVATKGSPIIDGEIDEIWASAEVQDVLKVDKFVIPSSSATTGTLRTMWDDNYLYVLVEVDKHGIQVYQGEGGPAVDVDFWDCVEVSFSMSGNFNEPNIPGTLDADCGDIRVFPDGSKTGFGSYFTDSSDEVKAVMNVTDTDKYLAEYAFPWVGVTPEDGHVVALEIQINDHSKPARDGLINWSSDDGCWGWQRTDVHGAVVLGNEKGIAPETPAPDTEPSIVSTDEKKDTEKSIETSPEVTEKKVDSSVNTSVAPVTEEHVSPDSINLGVIIGIIAATLIIIAVVVTIIVKKKK